MDHLLRPSGTLLGALDLGGSSTQITYAQLEDNTHAQQEDKSEDKSECKNESAVARTSLVARSYAGFGAQAVRDRQCRNILN